MRINREKLKMDFDVAPYSIVGLDEYYNSKKHIKVRLFKSPLRGKLYIATIRNGTCSDLIGRVDA